MGWTVLGWESPFFEPCLEGSFAVRPCSALPRGSRVRQRGSAEARRVKSTARVSTGVDIPRGEVFVVPEMSYDLLQRLVLGDIQMVALVTLIVPFVHHLSWHLILQQGSFSRDLCLCVDESRG